MSDSGKPRSGRHTETGGVSCGLCETSLQQATLGFGVADLCHGIFGIIVVLSMILRKEVDQVYEHYRTKANKESGYLQFLRQVPYWFLYALLGGFTLQVAIGLLACLGATYRNSTLCTLWIIGTFLTAPVSPMAYSLLGLGRVYEWAAVGEFAMKMDEEELQFRRKWQLRRKVPEEGDLQNTTFEDDDDGWKGE